jgi:hypothetical protein
MYAHRLSYEHHVGPIPDGMVLDHLCRNKACIRPSHLDPVPQRTNIHRGASPTARNATATECIHGHPFDAENTYWRPDGKGRLCRACGRDRKMRAKLARATLRGYT